MSDLGFEPYRTLPTRLQRFSPYREGKMNIVKISKENSYPLPSLREYYFYAMTNGKPIILKPTAEA